MDSQQTKKLTFKPWYEWQMPPLWVIGVVGLVLVGISTLVFMKIGESMSAANAQAIPPTPVATGPGGVKVTD